jgi:hypothetical protein
MASSFRSLRSISVFAIAACASVAGAQAQWLPPIGAAPPAEIAQRLRAEGYVLVGPLHRNQTVYLVDVSAGPAGRQRLVIDAWSGAILQRFVVRPRSLATGHGGYGGDYVFGGGDFAGPPPLGPPPARDFFAVPGGNYAYGGSPDVRIPSDIGPVYPPESPSRRKVRPRPASAPHRQPETTPATASAPTETPIKPADAGANATVKDNPVSTGAAAAPSSSPASPLDVAQPTDASAKANESAAGASPASSQEAPKDATPRATVPTAAPAPAQTQAKNAAQPQTPAPPKSAPPVVEKQRDKSKVNDVPVNPLE